jgi:mRNA-degrading endonuclease RelE of RelBE toxin-antitoxin system
MYANEVTPQVSAQIETLHPKRFRQVALRIFTLQMNPRPPDSVLIDIAAYRVDVGPYAITYEVDDARHRVRVFLLEEREEP